MAATPTKPRLQDLDPAAMSEAQRRVYDAIAGGPRGAVAEPFRVWLQSPELADRIQNLGNYLRFENQLGSRYSELAILIAARHWDNAYEWYHHVPAGLKGGVPANEIAAIARRARPDFEDDRAAAIYDFATELLRERSVGEANFKSAVEAFGQPGVVELIAILGHYSTFAMLLGTFEIEPPGAAGIPLAP